MTCSVQFETALMEEDDEKVLGQICVQEHAKVLLNFRNILVKNSRLSLRCCLFSGCVHPILQGVLGAARGIRGLFC